MAKTTTKVSEAETAGAAPATVDGAAGAPTVSSAEGAGPSASDAPQQETGAAGTNSTDALIDAGKKTASVEQIGKVSDFLKGEEDKFRAAFPHLVKAIDTWKATDALPPRGVRIVSLVEGFRRAGIAHGREAADYPIEAFKLPEDLEALFSEPKLAVTFI